MKKYIILFLVMICFACQENKQIVAEPQIIPAPQKLIMGDDYFTFNISTVVKFQDKLEAVKSSFDDTFNRFSTLEIYGNSNKIEFLIDNSIQDEEGYSIEVTKNLIQFKSKTLKGAFYAIQTFRQIIPHEFENDKKVFKELKIPFLKIEDQPQFSYRGMHLDVSRHMYPVEFIKKYIDALAMLKMNIFHWHLTDDQGWRVEIKKYPKLQEVAAYRKETLLGHYSDQPHQFDGKKYGGYYTQEEVKDIVAYAQERFVTVIPEIEMPGHSQAVIAAYPEFGCTNKQVEVATKWGVFDNILCPKEETFQFLEDVLDEVLELFPSKYIHIGGDEAPKTQWKNSQLAQELIRSEGLKDEHELQNYFITRMEKYLNSKGRQIIGWDEILEGGLAPNATVMSWRGTNGAVEAAKSGHNVVMTPTSHCYFDYYQSDNEDEPTAIGGYLPLEKVYNFNPIPEELSPDEAKYVMGAQGNIWTEYMPTSAQVEYMAFPRILAMSEVGWTSPENKNYENFVTRVENFHKRLEVLDINYANHLYEIKGEMITVNNESFYKLGTLTEGKDIRYTLDGTAPELNSEIYKSQIPITKDMSIKAAVFNSEKQLGKTFTETINYHKGVGAKITIDKEPHKAYFGSGADGLINGISGSDSRYGDKEWLGFWGEDIVVTIDFSTPKEISSISTRFHNGNGQWIYAPEEIGFSFKLQEDGRTIHDINLIKNNGDIMVNHIYKMEPTFVSQIEIVVKNYGTIPKNKQGAGNKAWTFIDEIIIN